MLDEGVQKYATELADSIESGEGPPFVLWHSKEKIHVVIGRASPPDDSMTSMSHEKWRKQLRDAIHEELARRGWEIRGGNRFWRPGTTEKEERDWEAIVDDRLQAQRQSDSKGGIGVIAAIVVVGGLLLLILSGLMDSGLPKKKIYYDIIATQDQNPYSNEWNQGVKEAAAEYYNVPMSVINDIIMEGATKGWPQPDPP